VVDIRTYRGARPMRPRGLRWPGTGGLRSRSVRTMPRRARIAPAWWRPRSVTCRRPPRSVSAHRVRRANRCGCGAARTVVPSVPGGI